MILYRDMGREEATAEKLADLGRLAGSGDALGFLVELGELEQAVLDAVATRADTWGPVPARLRAAAHAAGAAFLRPEVPGAGAAALARAVAVLEVVRAQLPSRLAVRPPEGYAHYALDPADYARAAARYVADEGERAARAVVLGVRTIGTSLSAVVAAAVGSACSLTVRPRGPTGERHVRADDLLCQQLRAWLEAAGDVLVVDEGPGVTGETFEAVARWLAGLGVSAGRIVLFPCRTWGMAAAPPERVAWFAAARKYAPPLADARPKRVAAGFGLTGLRNLSAGAWRDLVPGAADQPAMPARERLKFRGCDAAGRSWLLRYVGLGRWGRTVAARVEALARAGLGAEPAGFRDGFLLQPWEEGRPLRAVEPRDAAFLDALAAYLVARAPLFRTGRAADVGSVVAMLRENAEAALGAGTAVAAAARRLERLPPREAVVVDARLHAREWLRQDGGVRKVDAADHGDGIWFPGPVDFAWDLAGAAVEHSLGAGVVARLAARCAAARGERPAELAAAARAYAPAYAASAFGEALLSSWEATGAGDRARLEREADRYRAALAAALPAA